MAAAEDEYSWKLMDATFATRVDDDKKQHIQNADANYKKAVDKMTEVKAFLDTMSKKGSESDARWQKMQTEGVVRAVPLVRQYKSEAAKFVPPSKDVYRFKYSFSYKGAKAVPQKEEKPAGKSAPGGKGPGKAPPAPAPAPEPKVEEPPPEPEPAKKGPAPVKNVSFSVGDKLIDMGNCSADAGHVSWASKLLLKKEGDEGATSEVLADDVFGIFSEDGSQRLDTAVGSTVCDKGHTSWSTVFNIETEDGGPLCYNKHVFVKSANPENENGTVMDIGSSCAESPAVWSETTKFTILKGD